MSFLGDVLDFEKFNLKDIWEKVKDDPERLLLGAVDPFSTRIWNSVLDKDWEPMVDQMGGAYGGHTFSSFGNTDGGVYGRAREAGIDTEAGGQMHDLAHVLAAMYAGGYGSDKLAGRFGRGSLQGKSLPGLQTPSPQSQQRRRLVESPPPVAMVTPGASSAMSLRPLGDDDRRRRLLADMLTRGAV